MIKKLKETLSPANHKRFGAFLVLVIVLVALGIISRLKADYELNKSTQQNAVTLVSTTTANEGKENESIILPGSVLAWHEATIYARTNGYVKKWLVDIGSKVKKGDILAEIEIPEIESQLRQAQAELNTAIANYQLAQSTADRWQNLLKTNSVSKQEADEKSSAAISLKAVMNSAKAKLDTLKNMVNFKYVIAPFNGVITNRSTDVGSLINEGSTTSTTPLFRIAQIDKLRLYVKVPQNYSSRITPDIKAELSFAEHPGEIFTAKFSQTANALEPSTRTLLTEFQVDNPEQQLFAGGYAQVRLNMPSMPGSVILPINTLLFRPDGVLVAILDKDKKVELRKIKIARDFGTTVEINSGIQKGERIIVNPPDSLLDGAIVKTLCLDKTKANTEKQKI